MTVDIPAEFQPFVQAAINRGDFRDESEVVGEALRVLQAREQRLKELRREVQLGIDQLDRGEYSEYDERSLKEFFEQIKTEGRKSLATKATGR